MQALDTVARVIGYGAMLCGILWLLNTYLNDRAAMRAAAEDRAWLDRLKEHEPERYEREVWWRNNLERRRAGLPTDPGFEETGQQMAQSVAQALRSERQSD